MDNTLPRVPNELIEMISMYLDVRPQLDKIGSQLNDVFPTIERRMDLLMRTSSDILNIIQLLTSRIELLMIENHSLRSRYQIIENKLRIQELTSQLTNYTDLEQRNLHPQTHEESK